MRRQASLAGLLVAITLGSAACGGPPGSSTSASASAGAPSPGATPPSAAASTAPGPGASGGASSPAPSSTASPAELPSRGTWARIEVDGPAPEAREDHTWTVDESGSVAWLFGGRGGGRTFGDLWAFDLAAGTWTRYEPPGDGPAARFGHEAAWIPGRGLAVTLGQAGSTFFDDVWLFDPATTTWRSLPAAGDVPVSRYGSCSGLGPDGRLWISHGFTGEGVRFADTRSYDFAAEVWADVTPATGETPVKRCLHACWWTSANQLALYGGQTNGAAALGDLWRLDPAAGTWAEVGDPGPAARQLAAIGRAGTFTIVFGGRDIDRRPLADTWLLPDAALEAPSSGTAFTTLPTSGDGPPARSGAAFVHDAVGGRLLLFGGIGESPLGDLWSLTLD